MAIKRWYGRNSFSNTKLEGSISELLAEYALVISACIDEKYVSLMFYEKANLSVSCHFGLFLFFSGEHIHTV